MRRLVVAAPGRVDVVETEAPAAGPGSVVVDVAACGVCGSDLPAFIGREAPGHAGYFGHEFSGVVVDVGEGVDDLAVGDRVASGLVRACSECPRCRAGHPNYCRELRHVLSPGGFAEQTRVAHAPEYAFLTPVPAGIGPVEAAFHEPLSCAVRIVEQGELQTGDAVAVIGLGAMGLLGGALARLWGAGGVVGIDVLPARLELAASLGLAPVDRSAPDWRRGLEDVVGAEGPSLVIETSGRTSAFADALAIARLGARVVVGSVYQERAAELDLRPIMRKELRVIGAKGPFPRAAASGRSLALEVLVSGRLPIDRLSRAYPVDEANRAFDAALNGTVLKPVVCFGGGKW
jgi:L-iditol 2-dehydrogenase